MSERELWRRDDGWEIEVSRDPFTASHTPMTNGTLGAEVLTYEIQVTAMLAHGYVRVDEPLNSGRDDASEGP